MNKVMYLILHCAATPEGKSFTAKDIDKMHKQRGFKKIGYHYVIDLDGTIEKGRAENEIGAHCIGYNSKSIGICYIGGVAKDGTTHYFRLARGRICPHRKFVPCATCRSAGRHACHARYQRYGFGIYDVYGHACQPRQKLLCPLLGRMLENLLRCTVLSHHAVIHKQHLIRHIPGKLHLMGNDHHGRVLIRQSTDNL